jgi:hypothetical protein
LIDRESVIVEDRVCKAHARHDVRIHCGVAGPDEYVSDPENEKQCERGTSLGPFLDVLRQVPHSSCPEDRSNALIDGCPTVKVELRRIA